jgi:hypothetical protein
MNYCADGLGSSVRIAVAARPLLAASSQVPPVMPSFVALAISVTEIPVVGSSAAILKAFSVSLVLRIYEIVHITNGNVAVTDLGSQTGILPFVPVDGAIPVILNFDVLRDVTASIVSLAQLTAAGVPGFQPLSAPATVVAPVSGAINPMVALAEVNQLLAPNASIVVGSIDVVQRVQLLTQLQNAGYIIDVNAALNFAQGLAPLPPAAAAPLPLLPPLLLILFLRCLLHKV